jgi:acyl carrier protein
MTSAKLRSLLDGDEAFHYTPDVHDDACLLEAGVIDSFGMIALVMRIEADFGIRVMPEDATADGFRSISSIARLIEAKQNEHHRG